MGRGAGAHDRRDILMHAIHVEFMCKQALKALVNNLLLHIVRMFSVGVESIFSRKLPFERTSLVSQHVACTRKNSFNRMKTLTKMDFLLIVLDMFEK